MIHKCVKVRMLNFEPVDEHMCYLRLKFKIFNITIISVLAKTEDKDDTVKRSFYDILDRVYQTLPKHDAVIVMGNMNTKVGEETLNSCTGKYRPYKVSNYNVKNYVILRPAENSSLLLPCSHLKILIFKLGYPQTEKHLIN